MLAAQIRRLGRSIGVGNVVLRLKTLQDIGVLPLIKTCRAKKTLLPRILRAAPIPVGGDQLELKMLLHKARFLEGLWSLYSFLRHANKKLQLTVHSDGSLDADCVSALKKLFPGARVIHRHEADALVGRLLARKQLNRCNELRDRVILSLKLLDFLAISETRNFISLDSDILTYQEPSELLNPPIMADGRTLHLYSADNNELSYALPREVMEKRLRHPIASKLNSGLMNIQNHELSLDMVEDYLERSRMLTDPQANLYYTDQTIWAALLQYPGARPLSPNAYTICGGPHDSVTAHYCGGGYWATRFYREGLPHLAAKFALL